MEKRRGNSLLVLQKFCVKNKNKFYYHDDDQYVVFQSLFMVIAVEFMFSDMKELLILFPKLSIDIKFKFAVVHFSLYCFLLFYA